MVVVKQSEASIKKGICEYLDILQSQGKIYWDRLNAGKAWMRYGAKMYPIQLCKPGTPDLMVIQRYEPSGAPNKAETRLVFLECKSSKGKLSPEQTERHAELKQYGAEVYTVRSIDEVMKILDSKLRGGKMDKQAQIELLDKISEDDALLEVGRKAVEDALVEWRDSRLSMLRNNGLVIKEKDGSPSNIIRFGTETALKIALKAISEKLIQEG